MKIKLFPTGNSTDVLAGEPVVIDPDEPAAASSRGTIALHKQSFLPESTLPPQASPLPFFDDHIPVSPASRFAKITLAPVRQDGFAGLGDGPASRVESVTLAPVAKSDFAGLGDPRPAEVEETFTKSLEGAFSKFSQFAKVKETGDGNVEVWGIATHEAPDLDDERCDYATAKKAYQEWSDAAKERTESAGQEVSLGNIRRQHSSEPAGKATKLHFDDDAKEIWIGSIPINDEIRKELQAGYLTGYSQGGSYAWRRCTDCGKDLPLQQANNFCPNCKKRVPVRFGLKRLSEVSYVDSPCTGKGFSYVRADGSEKFVSFAKRGPSFAEAVRLEELKLWGFL